MKHAAICNRTDKVLAIESCSFELADRMEWEFPPETSWRHVKIHECRGCDKNDLDDYVPERFDYYGITTGHWCESCYNSGKYPYRRDAYDPYNEYGTR